MGMLTILSEFFSMVLDSFALIFTGWIMALLGPEFVKISEDGVLLKVPFVSSFDSNQLGWQSKKRAPIVVSASILVTGIITLTVEYSVRTFLFPFIDLLQIIGLLLLASIVTLHCKTKYKFSIEMIVYFILGLGLLFHTWVGTMAVKLWNSLGF